MGFGDKLKGLRDQAQTAVADNKEKIQGAVMSVGEAANTKTKGKYADKIAKVGEKVTSSVDKMGGTSEEEPGASAETAIPEAETTVADAPEATVQPATPATPAGSPPEFDD